MKGRKGGSYGKEGGIRRKEVMGKGEAEKELMLY